MTTNREEFIRAAIENYSIPIDRLAAIAPSTLSLEEINGFMSEDLLLGATKFAILDRLVSDHLERHVGSQANVDLPAPEIGRPTLIVHGSR